MRSFGTRRPRRDRGFQERIWPLLDVRARLARLLQAQAPGVDVHVQLALVRADTERRRLR